MASYITSAHLTTDLYIIHNYCIRAREEALHFIHVLIIECGHINKY